MNREVHVQFWEGVGLRCPRYSTPNTTFRSGIPTVACLSQFLSRIGAASGSALAALSISRSLMASLPVQSVLPRRRLLGAGLTLRFMLTAMCSYDSVAVVRRKSRGPNLVRLAQVDGHMDLVVRHGVCALLLPV